MKHRLFLLAGCALALWLGACASPSTATGGPASVTLPLSHAWFDGRSVEYITTDVSDAGVARMLGVNHVPRLADALVGPGRRSLLERVYKFANDEQRSVFQSAPVPTGAANTSVAYSPLWRVVVVRRVRASGTPELKSEEAVLAAADRGEVTLEVTDIVVNCPITRSVDGLPLRDVR